MPDMPKGLSQYRIRLDERNALRMTCQNANCINERSGWVIVLDPADEKHRGAAQFIEQDSGRRYVMFVAKDGADYLDKRGGETGVDVEHLRAVVKQALPHFMVYVFPPGQPCFARHLDREVVFTRETRERVFTHDRPLGFNEDQNEAMFRYYRATGRTA